MSNSSCRFKSGPRYQRQLQVIIVHFGRFFYAKKTARRKALPRLYSLPGELFSSCGLYCPPLCIPTLNNKNAYPVNPPPSDTMRIAGMRSVCSRSAIIAPTRAPARAGMMMIVVIATIIISAVQIFMALPFKRSISLATKGYFRPLINRESLLVSYN